MVELLATLSGCGCVVAWGNPEKVVVESGLRWWCGTIAGGADWMVVFCDGVGGCLVMTLELHEFDRRERPPEFLVLTEDFVFS